MSETLEYLGLVADRKRSIRNGKEYDKYFPKADGITKVIKKSASVRDTVHLMEDIVKRTLSDTRKIADLLKDNTLEETLSKDWNFVFHHVQYKMDAPGREQLRRPARTWADRSTGADCDCMSILLSSILTNQKIKHRFRITDYGNGWQHVYIVVPKPNSTGDLDVRGNQYFTLDCVLDQYDYEKRPIHRKMDFDMSSNLLNGIPLEYLSGSEMDEQLNCILGDSDFVRIVNGMSSDGTLSGDSSPAEVLSSLKDYLIKTRDFIRAHPESMLAQGGADAHLKMFDYAIDRWDTPERDAALAKLEAEEGRWNFENHGTSGLDEDFDLNGEEEFGIMGMPLGGLSLKKLWKGVKKVVSTAAKATASVAKVVGKGVVAAAKAVIKYNPLAIMVRGGIILAIKTNLKGMAKRMGESSDAYSKGEKIFVKNFGGKASNFRSAVDKGKSKKSLLGFGDTSNMELIKSGFASAYCNGLGVLPAIPAAVTAAMPAILKILKAITGKDHTPDEVGQAINDQISKGIVAASEYSPVKVNTEGESSGAQDSSDIQPRQKESFFSKVGVFVKNNPTTVALSALTIGIGVFVLTRKNNSLQGVKHYRARKSVKTRKFLPKGRKVKAITLS